MNGVSLRIAVLGAGALGTLYGGKLARAGHQVTLIEPELETLATVAGEGARIVERSGEIRTDRVAITADPATAGPVELLLVCVRYWETGAAVRAALPLLGPECAVLTLQGGWGDADEIAGIVGPGRVAIGVCAEWAVSIGPGRVEHRLGGTTPLGGYRADYPIDRLAALADLLGAAGLPARPVADIRPLVWDALAVDACAPPLCAILNYLPAQLAEHAGALDLMRALQREIAAVARAQGYAIDEAAAWDTLIGQLADATGPAADRLRAMRHDLDRLGRTDVDRLNGAVVVAGRALGLPTPYNDSVLWLIHARERRDDGVQ